LSKRLLVFAQSASLLISTFEGSQGFCGNEKIMTGSCLTLLTLFLLTSVPVDKPGLFRFSFTEPHMGTRFQISLYAANEDQGQRGARAAFQRIADLDQKMTDYRSTSELMQLCARAGGPPVSVSDDLFFVLSKAQQVSEISGGAFDVTVGPVVRLWRLSRRTGLLPDPDKLARARALVGYQNVRLDADKHTVQLLKAGMQLDLGGIAKGHAADAALEVLRKQGVTRALVAAGGDIAVSGPPPDAAGWTIGIAPLLDPNRRPKRLLLLHDAAVSTSGDAEQHVEIGGKRYSHIIDPRTGMAVVGRQSVTVVAPNGITADSMTKIVCVLGPEKGLPIIDATPGVAAYGVRETPKGLEAFESKRFRQVPHKSP
jgi:FAD:protein FMN transferase